MIAEPVDKGEKQMTASSFSLTPYKMNIKGIYGPPNTSKLNFFRGRSLFSIVRINKMDESELNRHLKVNFRAGYSKFDE